MITLEKLKERKTTIEADIKKVEEAKLDMSFEEDDTPVTDDELAKKTGNGK